jgi:hypothetical protein
MEAAAPLFTSTRLRANQRTRDTSAGASPTCLLPPQQLLVTCNNRYECKNSQSAPQHLTLYLCVGHGREMNDRTVPVAARERERENYARPGLIGQ